MSRGNWSVVALICPSSKTLTGYFAKAPIGPLPAPDPTPVACTNATTARAAAVAGTRRPHSGSGPGDARRRGLRATAPRRAGRAGGCRQVHDPAPVAIQGGRRRRGRTTARVADG